MPAPERRSYAGGALLASLVGDITSGSTSLSTDTSTGWPDGSAGPFHVVIDKGGVNEEKVKIDTRSGLTLTVDTGGRGADGTAAVAHSAGVSVELCATALDFDEANRHTADPTQDDHTQYLLKSIATTKGDLLAATGAGVLARVGVGTDDQVLTADSSTSTGLAWAPGGAGSVGVLGTAKGGGAVISSATWAVIDATASVVFTVPASGVVLGRVSATVQIGGTNTTLNLGIDDGAEVISGEVLSSSPTTATVATAVSVAFRISGLSPGTSKTYKAGGKRTAGTGNCTVFGTAQGVVLEVFAS